MKKIVWSMGLFLGIIALLSAQDFTSLGLELKSESKEGQYAVYQFRAPGNMDLSVSFRGVELRQADQARLQGIVSIYQGFQFLIPSSVRVILTDERAEILVIPRSFRFKDRDLANYMPSGIQFFYTDFLEFDFRIVVENLFLRIRVNFSRRRSLRKRSWLQS